MLLSLPRDAMGSSVICNCVTASSWSFLLAFKAVLYNCIARLFRESIVKLSFGSLLGLYHRL